MEFNRTPPQRLYEEAANTKPPALCGRFELAWSAEATSAVVTKELRPEWSRNLHPGPSSRIVSVCCQGMSTTQIGRAQTMPRQRTTTMVPTSASRRGRSLSNKKSPNLGPSHPMPSPTSGQGVSLRVSGSKTFRGETPRVIYPTGLSTAASTPSASVDLRRESPRTPTKPRQVVGMDFPTHQELLTLWWNLKPEDRDTDFWTPKQIAHHIRYRESRIRAMCDEGVLPYIKIAGRIHVHVPSMLEFWLRKSSRH